MAAKASTRLIDGKRVALTAPEAAAIEAEWAARAAAGKPGEVSLAELRAAALEAVLEANAALPAVAAYLAAKGGG